MLENDENFEQIKDAYLRLVDKVIEMSEGVFLWARLAIRSLLAGMLRHDTVQALEKKLEVIPRDINDLYDRLLDSLEHDDRERAIKMLLLTVHNPFAIPLNSVVFAWIDNLSDPKFPPTDREKPSSRLPANEITQHIQRQLTSLTKGLLEVTPMKREMCGGMHEVNFFFTEQFVNLFSRIRNWKILPSSSQISSIQKHIIVCGLPKCFLRSSHTDYVGGTIPFPCEIYAVPTTAA